MTMRRISTFQLNNDSLTSTNLRMHVRQQAGPGPLRELILWLLLAALLFMLLADAAYAADRRSSIHPRSVEAGVPSYNIDAICRGAASISHVLETTAPDNAQNAYVYAVALNSAGRPGDALTKLADALARHPDNRQLLTLTIELEQQQGDLSAALAHAERLMTLQPDDLDLRRFVELLRAQAPR